MALTSEQANVSLDGCNEQVRISETLQLVVSVFYDV